MDSLTEREIARIARHEREAGLQRLSGHFSWPEFCDERQCFHQEFVYDVAMFASACGFPWPDVIRVAAFAKSIFPQLDALNMPKLVSLLREVLSECPNVTSVHQREFTQFLADTWIPRRRLFHAVVGGAANMSVDQLDLDVQLPPTPCPVAQGTDLQEWRHRCQQDELASMLRQKEEKLRVLRDGSRVTLAEVVIPEDEQLDKEGVSEVVGAAVRAVEDQMLASMTQEASLLSDILQLKLQHAELATRRLHSPVLSSTCDVSSRPCTPAKEKRHTAKAKTGLRTKPSVNTSK